MFADGVDTVSPDVAGDAHEVAPLGTTRWDHAFAALTTRSQRAWKAPGVMARTIELPIGTMPAPTVAVGQPPRARRARLGHQPGERRGRRDPRCAGRSGARRSPARRSPTRTAVTTSPPTSASATRRPTSWSPSWGANRCDGRSRSRSTPRCGRSPTATGERSSRSSGTLLGPSARSPTEVAMSQQAVSHHLRVLRGAGPGHRDQGRHPPSVRGARRRVRRRAPVRRGLLARPSRRPQGGCRESSEEP